MHFPGLGVNTKVVDIDKNYLNMQNKQNQQSRFRANGQKPQFSKQGMPGQEFGQNRKKAT